MTNRELISQKLSSTFGFAYFDEFVIKVGLKLKSGISYE